MAGKKSGFISRNGQSFFFTHLPFFFSYIFFTAAQATLWATSSRESSPRLSSGSLYSSHALL